MLLHWRMTVVIIWNIWLVYIFSLLQRMLLSDEQNYVILLKIKIDSAWSVPHSLAYRLWTAILTMNEKLKRSTLSAKTLSSKYFVCKKFRHLVSKGSTTVPTKGVDDKRQISATFTVFASSSFLPIQLVYDSKTKRFTKYDFLICFDVMFTPKHWSNYVRQLVRKNYLPLS